MWRPGWSERLIALRDEALVFAVALVLRSLVVVQLNKDPLCSVPVVDAATYVSVARHLAAGGRVDDSLFWQPIFYPLYLSLVFRVVGGSLGLARWIQAWVGSLACALMCRRARAIGSRIEGVLAGLMLALYGPLVAVEADFLSEGWAVFWSALLLWAMGSPQRLLAPRAAAGVGLAMGLATLTRSNFMAASLGLGTWLVWRFVRSNGVRRAVDVLLNVALGAAVVLLPAAAWTARHTGRFTVLPSSTGLNLFIGNNPRWEETVSVRPGLPWMRLIRQPFEAGVTGPWEQSDWFAARVARYIRERPWDFFRGLASKSLRLFSSREIPRNHDLYFLRRASPLLAGLLWKSDGFGFPFGVLLPLAVVGGWARRRELGGAFWIFIALYAASVVLVFPSDRYRLPLVPALCIAAAAGARYLGLAASRRAWKTLALGLLAVLAVGFLASRPRRFPEETLNFEAERLWTLGKTLADEQRLEEAERYLRLAAQRAPDMADAWNQLGCVLSQQGRWEEAVSCHERAVELAPDEGGFHYNLALALLESGRIAEAAAAARTALALAPDYRPARELAERIQFIAPEFMLP